MIILNSISHPFNTNQSQQIKNQVTGSVRADEIKISDKILVELNGTYWRQEIADAIFRILISRVISFFPQSETDK